MADWKAQVSYNYNPSCDAYSYPPGPDQNDWNLDDWNLDDWSEAMDLSNYGAGTTQNSYAPAAAADTDATTQEESPSDSPEQRALNDQCQYQGSVYLGDTQAGCLLLQPQQTKAYDAPANGVSRTGSETASDLEARDSPDSWTSGSSGEAIIPQADPATWVKKDVAGEASDGSPDAGKDVSSSHIEEPPSLTVLGTENGSNAVLQVPVPAQKKPSTAAVTTTKGKLRGAFSESQMTALVQRFSVQRYLTPAEMKHLSEMTGLTYKQVKTWFQNRRMKLRRHQKDNSWGCERYTINKDGPMQGAMYSNIPWHMPPYQGEALPHYNQHMMEAAFRKTAPQNRSFYMAAMGNAAAGSAGYPPWSSRAPQSAVPTGPQMAGWSMPPGMGHY